MSSSKFVAAALAVSAIAVVPGPGARADRPPTVTYQLAGSAPIADYVSYQDDIGQQHQAHVRLPWRAKFGVTSAKVFVISAEGPGSITCTILLDGKLVSQATAHGAPARTVCSN